MMQPQQRLDDLSLSRAGELIRCSLGSPVGRLIAAASELGLRHFLVSPIRTSSLAVGDTSLGGDRAHARVG